MKKFVIIILTTLLTFGCFAQEFVPFNLPYYEPITPTVEQQNEMQDYAGYIEWFVEKRYDWEEVWDSATFIIATDAIKRLSKSAIEQNILTLASKLHNLSDYELIIAYSYAEVYLGKYIYKSPNFVN